MRFISKSLVAGVATMAVVALGASQASATITPSSGTVTAKNTGNVSLSAGITDTCSTLDLTGTINMNNAAGSGGGGIITGWTPSGCTITPTGTFATPWTLNVTSHDAGENWTGTVTGVTVDISVCHFSGTLNVTYNNTGGMQITGGSLTGSPSFPCGTGSVTGAFDLSAGTGFPVLS